MKIDQVRESFEKFAKCQFGAYRLGKVEDFYSCKEVQDSWFAWQAAWVESRVALIVPLPETHNDWLDKQVVQYAIDEAGVSYD